MARRRLRNWAALVLLLGVGAALARGRSAAPIKPESDEFNPFSADIEVPSPPQPPSHQSESRKTEKPETRDAKKLHLRVVGVHDGDTITGLDDSKTQHKVRLDAIDVPELGQAFGQESKKP